MHAGPMLMFEDAFGCTCVDVCGLVGVILISFAKIQTERVNNQSLGKGVASTKNNTYMRSTYIRGCYIYIYIYTHTHACDNNVDNNVDTYYYLYQQKCVYIYI